MGHRDPRRDLGDRSGLGRTDAEPFGRPFDYARANGASPRFVAAERMELFDFDLTLIATPSFPDAQGDGFNDCTYTATCPAP